MSKQKRYTKVLKDAKSHLPPIWRKRNRSKKLCILLCHSGADIHLFQSQGRLLFLLKHCINIHLSFCSSTFRTGTLLQLIWFGGLGCLWLGFYTLWKLSCLYLEEDITGGCSAAGLHKSSKVQLFHLPFERDDQSSWWGMWRAGSAPGWGGNEWVQTEAQENSLFPLHSVQRVGQNGLGK